MHTNQHPPLTIETIRAMDLDEFLDHCARAGLTPSQVLAAVGA